MNDPTPQLPKAADMLERVRAEAAELRGFTITFMSLLLYVAIIISSTTHEQILRIGPVKLPLLDVEIPIVGFYWFMPGFLFFLHLYILIQHYLFSQLAFRFRAALERETDADVKDNLRRSLGNLPFLHWLAGKHGGFMNFLMTAFTVVSLILWPVWTFWWLQATFLPYHDNTIVWTQRAFLLLDTGLLAYLWAKILDDSDDAGHWWRPAFAPFLYVVTAPIKAALRWLCRLTDAMGLHRLTARLRSWLGTCSPPHTLPLAATFERWLLSVFWITALFFSFIVSTLPDSDEEKWLIRQFPASWSDPPKATYGQKQDQRRLFILTAWLHEQQRVWLKPDQLNDYDSARIRACGDDKDGKDDKAAEQKTQGDDKNTEVKPTCYWVDSYFPRNLILNERVLVANQGLEPEIMTGLKAKRGKTGSLITKPDYLLKVEGLRLQGRHLEYADFSASSLPNADLRRARLKSANLEAAKLEQVNFESAELPDANLWRATLSGADLSGATLSGANLWRATLSGADLSSATLSGADLRYATLSGVSLNGATLSGANLEGASLSGAVLVETHFSPNTEEQAKTETGKLNEALQGLAKYQGEDGKAKLKTRLDQFHQSITQPVDFSTIRDNSGCLADEFTINDLELCNYLFDPEAKKKAYEIWLKLACVDETEHHWVAQSIIVRAKYSPYRDFATLLAAKLQKTDDCPGLKNLDDGWEKRLLDAAKL